MLIFQQNDNLTKHAPYGYLDFTSNDVNESFTNEIHNNKFIRPIIHSKYVYSKKDKDHKRLTAMFTCPTNWYIDQSEFDIALPSDIKDFVTRSKFFFCRLPTSQEKWYNNHLFDNAKVNGYYHYDSNTAIGENTLTWTIIFTK